MISPHPIIDAAGFERSVNRLAHEIVERNRGAETLGIVGIRTRGDYLARRISQKIKEMEHLELPLGTLDITLYRDDLRGKLAQVFADILNAEARELEASGIDIIQFDEPAFNVFMEEVRDWGIATLEQAAAGLKCKTATHICYGYGIKANIDWKNSLGSEWRQYESTFPLLARSKIDQVSLECANSKVPLELIALLDGKDIMVGAIDVTTEQVETPEEVARVLRAAIKFVAPEKLYPCTNCGLVPLSRDAARGKLHALAAGAAIVRKELADSAQYE